MPVKTYNTRSTSGYVKWFAVLIATGVYISDVTAQNQTNSDNRKTFNQKTSRNNASSSALFQFKKYRKNTRPTHSKGLARSSRNPTKNIYYRNQQYLRRYRRHIAFQQTRTAKFSSRTGRALNVRQTYTSSQMEAKKPFLSHIVNRPGGTRRYRSGSPKPPYVVSKQRAQPTPKDRYSPSRWNTGWYAKWNRQRIAKTAHRGERAWRGDITGRKLILNNRATQAKRLDKRIVPYRKSRLNIGGAPPNRGQHANLLRDMKQQVRKVNTFGGIIYSSTQKTKSTGKKSPRLQLKQNPSGNRYALPNKKQNRVSQQTASFAGNIPRPQLKQNPSGNRYALPNKKQNRVSQQTASFAGNIPRPQLKQNPSGNRYALPNKKQNRVSQQTASFAGNIPRPQLKQNPSSSRYALPTKKQSRVSQQTASFAGNIRIARPRIGITGNPIGLVGTYPNRDAEQFSGNMKVRKFNSPMLHPDAQFAHSFVNNVQGERDLLTSLKLLWAKTFRKKNLQPPFLRGKSTKLRYDDRERKLWYR